MKSPVFIPYGQMNVEIQGTRKGERAGGSEEVKGGDGVV
jgi:hypothetical protein